ncbi:MAG: serine hydrolase domain-containing protein [Myxococcales bacterium]
MAASSQPFASVGNVLETAIAEGTVPGAVILCAREGMTRFHAAFGARQTQPRLLAATTRTVYDIASVTKAVSTSVLTMKAVAAGLITLDDQVSLHIPEFQGDGKDAVTVRQLLCHASGLPPHRPFYEQHTRRGAAPAQADVERTTDDPPGYHPIVLAAAAEPLIHRPGTLSVYSDLGFILLGALLERVTGTGIDVLFARAIAEPLGLSSTTFVNLRRPNSHEEFIDRYEVAPTQMSAARGRVVIGEVDDLNALAMGGVAGHAGLFSDAADLGTLAGALVAAWQGAGDPGVTAGTTAGGQAALSSFERLRGGDGSKAIVSREVVREFWRPAGIDGSTWRLGWDGPAEHESQAGARLSRRAVGHLGFTGCSLWIDPQAALWVVLLTNRVHPTVRQGQGQGQGIDPRFRALRAAVHDAAVEGLLGA